MQLRPSRLIYNNKNNTKNEIIGFFQWLTFLFFWSNYQTHRTAVYASSTGVLFRTSGPRCARLFSLPRSPDPRSRGPEELPQPRLHTS